MNTEETTCFYDHGYLETHHLDSKNILEYFSISQFYDRHCLNEILKMQSQFASIDISHKLTTTPGFYYIVEYEADNLFLIAKKKFDGRHTRILRMYYCMHGYIYCAPTMKSLSESRLIDSMMYLNDALDKYEEHKTFDWLTGYGFGEKKNEDRNKNIDTKFMFEVFREFDTKLNRL